MREIANRQTDKRRIGQNMTEVIRSLYDSSYILDCRDVLKFRLQNSNISALYSLNSETVKLRNDRTSLKTDTDVNKMQ